MKKTIAFLLSVIIAFSFASCGKEKAEMYCYSCGEGMAKSDSFCASCGTPAKETDSTSATEPETTTAETTTEETTTQVTTAAPTTQLTTKKTTTTVPKTAAPTTQKQTKPATTKSETTDPLSKYPFDVYMAAAAGLQGVCDYVVSPSSVVLEKVAYSKDMAADNYFDMDIELYCTYVNKLGGYTGITCHVSLSEGVVNMGQNSMYSIGNNYYANCHILDDDDPSGLFRFYIKLDVDKVVATHKANW
ncbi:MAG: hypothetical protein IIW48_04570 [Clostridia bacterium]|nr:hypothetical protein [Clostridia bacterium]